MDKLRFAHERNVTQTGAIQGGSDLLRVAEGQGVAMPVDTREGSTQFGKSAGTERADRQLSARPEDARGFAEDGIDRAPLDGQAGPPKIEAGILEG